MEGSHDKNRGKGKKGKEERTGQETDMHAKDQDGLQRKEGMKKSIIQLSFRMGALPVSD